jgi:hypothetical protein
VEKEAESKRGVLSTDFQLLALQEEYDNLHAKHEVCASVLRLWLPPNLPPPFSRFALSCTLELAQLDARFVWETLSRAYAVKQNEKENVGGLLAKRWLHDEESLQAESG